MSSLLCNRIEGGNRLSNRVLDYINNSTGAIMFFNMRSALLQTISTFNFINWSDNNILNAGLLNLACLLNCKLNRLIFGR